MSQQLQMFPVSPPVSGNSTSFVDNMRLPVHRWFRYSAGFSAQWAESVLEGATDTRVLDPFAGAGTTLLAAQAAGHESIGLDPHPFVSRVAQAKLHWTEDTYRFQALAMDILSNAGPTAHVDAPPALLAKCYPPEVLADLLGLRDAVNSADAPGPLQELLWLAFVAIIRQTSPVGTAQWQYVLPAKSKARSLPVAEAWRAQVALMSADMRLLQADGREVPVARFIARDARFIGDAVPAAWATHIVCSPPYANNYDYGDATRLEQTVLGEVTGWADLKGVRSDLVRACTQHMAGFDPEEALQDDLLSPIRTELEPIFRKLAEIRLEKGGRKSYHSMVVAYFHDLAAVWRELRHVTAPGASVCFVIGDSAPYGVYVPVDRFLTTLAEAHGFSFVGFDKVRDRNTKWKNRKHRVPLKEGRLWLEG